MPRLRCALRGRDACAIVARALAILALLLLNGAVVRADIELPPAERYEPIVIDAEQADRWQQGSHEVWVLHGHCVVVQGGTRAAGHEGVVWIKRDPESGRPDNRAIVYLEGDVSVASQTPEGADAGEAPGTIRDRTWLGELHSVAGVTVRVPNPGPEPAAKPALFRKALARRNGTDDALVQPAQYAAPTSDVAQPGGFGASAVTGNGASGVGVPPVLLAQNLPLPPGGATAASGGSRRIQVVPRSRVPFDQQIVSDPEKNQTMVQLRRGVTVIVDGLPGYGVIDISADNVVLWTAGLEGFTSGMTQDEAIPLEIYMEGNVVFRQGERTVYAQRMYYDVRTQVGTVLQAEILSPIPKFSPGALFRVRAAVAQQTGPGRFVAQDAYVTSSRLALPGYRLQAKSITLEDNQVPVIDPFTGQPQINPQTNEPLYEHDRLVTSRNNFVFIDALPVFYWPVIRNDIEQTDFYIRQARFKTDKIFGQQFLIDWDTYQILGMKRLPGTDWTFSTDYFTKRGPALGTAYTWKGSELFGLQGPYNGFLDAWGIHDRGLDTLGSDRVNLLPEPDRTGRYKILGRHRQYLQNNFQFTGELGLISDRNFLEQYFEREWDQSKDYDTDLMLKQYRGNSSWDVLGSVRINDWFTQTQWLPRGDHFLIGQSLLDDRLTWYEHSSVGYANMRIAAYPTDPQEQLKFTWLPWEANVRGGRYFTTQELDLPFAVGAVNVVPYAIGQLARWDQILQGPQDARQPDGSLNRAFGQFGVRASLPFWAVDPTVQSRLFNVNGIAHKVLFDVDASWAGATQDFSNIPLYDPIDDDNIEAFNRRFEYNTFGGHYMLPEYDPRYYALRYGLQSNVTSQSPEIAGDMTAVRVNLKQRWQTKRGLPGNQHVIDWITFNVGTAFFPQANRDNFGQVVGLTTYDFNWHIGDRVTLVSDGIFDYFHQGQKIATVGGFINRPPRGSLFLGFRSINGPDITGAFTPVNNEVLIASYSYRMSEKWISSAGATYDVAHNGNIGEQVMLTRIGESFLVSAGATVDASKKNYGFTLFIEPRFLPRTTLGRVGGAQIPLAGVNGLE